MVKVRDKIIIMLLLTVLIIFLQIGIKLIRRRGNQVQFYMLLKAHQHYWVTQSGYIKNLYKVQLEWQANSQKTGKITAEPFVLKDKIIEGTLSVVPLYRYEPQIEHF